MFAYNAYNKAVNYFYRVPEEGSSSAQSDEDSKAIASTELQNFNNCCRRAIKAIKAYTSLQDCMNTIEGMRYRTEEENLEVDGSVAQRGKYFLVYDKINTKWTIDERTNDYDNGLVYKVVRIPFNALYYLDRFTSPDHYNFITAANKNITVIESRLDKLEEAARSASKEVLSGTKINSEEDVDKFNANVQEIGHDNSIDDALLNEVVRLSEIAYRKRGHNVKSVCCLLCLNKIIHLLKQIDAKHSQKAFISRKIDAVLSSATEQMTDILKFRNYQKDYKELQDLIRHLSDYQVHLEKGRFEKFFSASAAFINDVEKELKSFDRALLHEFKSADNLESMIEVLGAYTALDMKNLENKELLFAFLQKLRPQIAANPYSTKLIGEIDLAITASKSTSKIPKLTNLSAALSSYVSELNSSLMTSKPRYFLLCSYLNAEELARRQYLNFNYSEHDADRLIAEAVPEIVKKEIDELKVALS